MYQIQGFNPAETKGKWENIGRAIKDLEKAEFVMEGVKETYARLEKFADNKTTIRLFNKQNKTVVLL